MHITTCVWDMREGERDVYVYEYVYTDMYMHVSMFRHIWDLGICGLEGIRGL